MAKILRAPRELLEFFKGSRNFRGIDRYFQDVGTTATETLKQTVNIEIANFTPTIEHDELFCNTDLIDININLPEGVVGKSYRIINTGSSGNRVIITPFTGNKLFGGTDPEFLIDEEILIMTFALDEDWF